MFSGKHITVSIACATCVLVLNSTAWSAVTTYTDRATFRAAAVNALTYEDFSGLQGYSDAFAVSGPLNASNLPSYYFTGSMAPGVSIDAISSHSLVWSQDTPTHGTIQTSKLWSPNSGVSSNGMKLSFDSANAIGLDLFMHYTYTSLVEVYDTSGGLLTSQVLTIPSTGKFFGLIADRDIGYIRAFNSSVGARPHVDNIEFGQAVPEPGTVGLMLLGLIVLAVKR